MDQKQMLCGVRQDHTQKLLVTVRGKPALNALIEQTPREILNGAKHFVAFPLATVFDLRLVPPPRPRVAQGAPLGKTRLIFKQDQTVAALGGTDKRRPFLCKPGQALGRIEMIRHKAGLLKREPEVVQQRTHVLAGVEDATHTPEKPPEGDGGATSRPPTPPQGPG